MSAVHRFVALFCCLLLSWSAVASDDAWDTMPDDERLAAAQAAGDYLLRVLDEESGRFTYVVKPYEGKIPETYNLLRHAGTIYALCQLYEATQASRWLQAAERAATLLQRHIRPVSIAGQERLVLLSDYGMTSGGRQEGLVVKTGGCALAIVALLSLDQARGTKHHQETAVALGDYIIFTQQADGNIRSKYELTDRQFDDWQSAYYPGEALLALALLQQQVPTPERGEAMTRLLLYLATNWQVANLDPRLQPREFDHWSLIGLAAAWDSLDAHLLLQLSTPEAPWTRNLLLETASRYCRDELRRQRVAPGDPQHGDLVPQLGNLTPTATRLEGICSIYRLRQQEGLAIEAWDVPIQRALRFLQRGQYGPDLEHALSLEITGGVRRHISPFTRHGAEIRIDYCQHAISAWLGYPRT